MMTLMAFGAGILTGGLLILAYTAYHYYKAVKEAHDEGWDGPN